MLTIVTALPWEAAAFTSRLRARRRIALGPASDSTAWALRGTRAALQDRLVPAAPRREAAFEIDRRPVQTAANPRG